MAAALTEMSGSYICFLFVSEILDDGILVVKSGQNKGLWNARKGALNADR